MKALILLHLSLTPHKAYGAYLSLLILNYKMMELKFVGNIEGYLN